ENDRPNCLRRRLVKARHIERRRTHEQLVEQNPQRIDVAADVDVALPRLLGRHVRRRAKHWSWADEQQRPLGEPWPRGLGDTEIDEFDDRHAIARGHEHIGRLQVAMNDAFLMGVLYSAAQVPEEYKPLAHCQPILVAVLRDGQSAYQLHYKV